MEKVEGAKGIVAARAVAVARDGPVVKDAAGKDARVAVGAKVARKPDAVLAMAKAGVVRRRQVARAERVAVKGTADAARRPVKVLGSAGSRF